MTYSGDDWDFVKSTWHPEAKGNEVPEPAGPAVAGYESEEARRDALGRLAGGIAHDFNNLLATILGHSELCLGLPEGKGKMHEGLIAIRQAGEKAATLTRRILECNRQQDPAPENMGLTGSAPRATASPAGKTILVVEDEEIVRRFCRVVLEHQGFRVLEAGDGKSAMALVGHSPEPIDMLLTDLLLPGIPGEVLACQFLKVKPDSAVLLMSANRQSMHMLDECGKPNIRFLPKPFLGGTLLEHVRGMLRGL